MVQLKMDVSPTVGYLSNTTPYSSIFQWKVWEKEYTVYHMLLPRKTKIASQKMMQTCWQSFPFELVWSRFKRKNSSIFPGEGGRTRDFHPRLQIIPFTFLRRLGLQGDESRLAISNLYLAWNPLMTLFFLEKALFLGDWPSKVEVIGVPGGCWQLKYVWNLSPQTLGEDEAIFAFWRSYFSKGLVKNHPCFFQVIFSAVGMSSRGRIPHASRFWGILFPEVGGRLTPFCTAKISADEKWNLLDISWDHDGIHRGFWVMRIFGSKIDESIGVSLGIFWVPGTSRMRGLSSPARMTWNIWFRQV